MCILDPKKLTLFTLLTYNYYLKVLWLCVFNAVVGNHPSSVEVKATSGQKAIHHHTRTSSLQSRKLTCKKQQDIQQQQEHRAILKYRDSVKNTQPQHLQVIIIC